MHKYLFITHRTYDNGKIKRAGIDQIMEFFIEKGAIIYLLEHPIESDFPTSFLRQINFKEKEITKEYKIWPKNEPWRWIGEIFLNFFWIKNLIKKEKVSVIFSVDALNTISILLLKILNKNLEINFFSPDYSDKRSRNCFLDKLYNLIYKLSLKFADKTFVVSSRSYELLSSLYPEKVIFLPNSPFYDKIKKVSTDVKNKYSLVFCAGRLTERVNLEGIFFALKILKISYPQINLHLIGKINFEAEKLINKFEINNNVKIHDFLSHNETLNYISQCYIGISYYSNLVSHIYWGDSLKIREYSAAGLPTVCDGLTSTALEMEKAGAGFIIESPEEMAKKIKELLENSNLYNKIRSNALIWAKKMDKKIILEKNLIFKKNGNKN